jgi:hypothetical protein
VEVTLDISDPRWSEMLGGYRIPYDPRPALNALAKRIDDADAWDALWSNLYHQGDVGEASYAAVPHLARIYLSCGKPNWNVYALVATIELCRVADGNPSLGGGLRASYEGAWKVLVELGLREILHTEDALLTRSIFAVISIAKRQPVLGKTALNFNESELANILNWL